MSAASHCAAAEQAASARPMDEARPAKRRAGEDGLVARACGVVVRFSCAEGRAISAAFDAAKEKVLAEGALLLLARCWC